VTGVAIAWLTERTRLPGGDLVGAGGCPAGDPGVCAKLCLGQRGALDARPLRGRVSLGFAYYPFIYMPVAAVLRRLDPTLEDVAASLGTPPWRVFFRVVLPQLKLAICGGALLVALHLLAEYGLYVMIRFDTFTTAIYDQFQSLQRPGGQHAGGRAGLVLPGDPAAGRRDARKARYARIGAGAAREQKRWPLKPAAAALGSCFSSCWSCWRWACRYWSCVAGFGWAA
jgi:iron(III) transport system permease protein